MRHAVMGFFILIMLIFAGASIYTAETKTMHQNELDSILGAAMEESMEILTVNPTYSIGKEVEGKSWQQILFRICSCEQPANRHLK